VIAQFKKPYETTRVYTIDSRVFPNLLKEVLMKTKIFASLLLVGMIAGSFASNVTAAIPYEKGIIYWNPLTGETDYTNCVPSATPALCWTKIN